MKLFVIVSISFFTTLLFLIISTFLPAPLAALLLVVGVLYILRSEDIHGRTALSVSILYLSISVTTDGVGWNPSGITEIEQTAFFVFGLLGLGYLAVEGIVRNIASSASYSTRWSALGKLGSSILGTITVISVAFHFRKFVSIRSYAAIGIVPAILLNTALQNAELGVLGELLVGITSFGTIGMVLGLAFLFDSVHHAVSGLREFRGGKSGETVENGSMSIADIQQMPDKQFHTLLERLVLAVHDKAVWVGQDIDGFALLYAESESGSELIISTPTTPSPMGQKSSW